MKMGGSRGHGVGGSDPGFGRATANRLADWHAPKPAQTRLCLRGSLPPTS